MYRFIMKNRVNKIIEIYHNQLLQLFVSVTNKHNLVIFIAIWIITLYKTMIAQNLWDTQFYYYGSSHGISAEIYTCEVWNNELIFGGNFTNGPSGLTNANGIVRYDIQQYSYRKLGNDVNAGVMGQNNMFNVSALKCDDHYLWVGGNFTQAGGQEAFGIARYDLINNTWKSFNSAQYYPLSNVYAIDVAGNDVYIGGNFSQSLNGNTLNHIVRLNKNDENFYTIENNGNIGANGVIHTIFNDGQRLWIGGSFTEIAGTEALRIAYLDLNNQSWHSLQINGTKGISNGIVFKIKVFNDTLFVSGSFNEAFGATTSNFLMIDLNNMQIIHHTITFNHNVYDFTKIGNRIYLGGWFTQPYKGMCAYNLTTQTIEYTGGPDILSAYQWPNVQSVTQWNEKVIITGVFNTIEQSTDALSIAIYHPDEKFWCNCPGQKSNGVNGKVNKIVKLDENKIIVGGEFIKAGPCVVANKIAIFDKSTDTWYPLGKLPGNYGVLDIYSTVYDILVDGDDIYIAGSFQQAGGNWVYNLTRYHLPTKTFHYVHKFEDGIVMSLAKRGDWIYAGGSFKRVNNNYNLKHLVKFNKVTGVVEPAEIEITGQVAFVNRIICDDDRLLVGGYYDGSFLKGYGFGGMANFYGHLFLTNPVFNGQILDMAYKNNVLYITGVFSKVNNIDYVATVKYDFNDHQFKPIDPSDSKALNTTVRAIDYAHNRIYLAGRFSKAGPYQHPNVRRVAVFNENNNQWQLFGNEQHNGIGDTDFSNAHYVEEIAVIDGEVWIGGEFSYVNANNGDIILSSNIARWTNALVGIDELFTDKKILPIKLYPNPAENEFYIDFINDPFTLNIRIEIYDYAGKIIKTFNNVQSNKSMNIKELQTGIYFVKIIQNDNVYIQKLIKN